MKVLNCNGESIAYQISCSKMIQIRCLKSVIRGRKDFWRSVSSIGFCFSLESRKWAIKASELIYWKKCSKVNSRKVFIWMKLRLNSCLSKQKFCPKILKECQKPFQASIRIWSWTIWGRMKLKSLRKRQLDKNILHLSNIIDLTFPLMRTLSLSHTYRKNCLRTKYTQMQITLELKANINLPRLSSTKNLTTFFPSPLLSTKERRAGWE